MATFSSDLSDELALWYSKSGARLRAQLAAALPAALAGLSGTAHLLIGMDELDSTALGLAERGLIDARFADVFGADAKCKFMPQSLDAVILLHSLDVSSEPQRVLHIAAELTAKSGYIVIVGFNPHSLFGLLRLPLRFLRRHPWQRGFYSSARLCDWLHVLNYEVRLQTSLAALPPQLARLPFSAKLQQFVHWLLPYWGTLHILVAKRPWFPLTGVGERQVGLPLGVLAPPATARTSNDYSN